MEAGIQILVMTLHAFRSEFPNCWSKVWFRSLYPCNMILKGREPTLVVTACDYTGNTSVLLLFFQETLLQAHLWPRPHQVKMLMTSPGKTWPARTGARGKLTPALPRTVNWKYEKKLIWVTTSFFLFSFL